ncbi:F-box domain-containing protein [Mycena venus]|uniref:F-box domain-containing protein n=1 Tax=Mycena venus TaxID=2733690 RepID=A0A8H6YQA6_9AGAR|nr:F-box domain-containing protein [Mycena venus]
MTLCDLPIDIILDVVNFLELPDPISLLLTCSALYGLSDERSFWISVLETTRRKSPIACPPHSDLSQYPLDRLKGLVISWSKLQINWNQPFPQIVQPATTTHLPGPAQIIFMVQGTDILVLTMKGSVFCWDAKNATPFPLRAVETGGHITQVSGLESAGICVLAFFAAPFAAPHAPRRYILTIKHAAGKAIDFTSEVSQVSMPYGPHFESVFVTEDMVGTISAIDNQEDCILTVSGVSSDDRLLDSTSVLKLHRPLPSHALMLSFAYKGHLYILLEDSESVQIQHISRKSLRSGGCEESSLYISEIDSSYDEFAAFCYMIPSTPFYGISAVFVRLEGHAQGDTSRSTCFTFLPTTLTHAADDGVSSPLAFDTSCVTEWVSGVLAEISLVWLDHSGFNAVAVIQPVMAFEPPRLVLVRYHPETRSTSSHTLTVPETINPRSLSSVCIDDTAGVVHLVDTAGLLSTLRYV